MYLLVKKKKNLILKTMEYPSLTFLGAIPLFKLVLGWYKSHINLIKWILGKSLSVLT